MFEKIKSEYNPFILQIQSRLADTDNLGHISNVAYVEFIETARTEWHAFTKNSRKVLDTGWDWILGELRMKWKKEGFLSDVIRIMMWCSRIGAKSWDFSYAFVNQKDDIIAIAQSTQISYDYENQRTQQIPKEILHDLKLRSGEDWSELS